MNRLQDQLQPNEAKIGGCVHEARNLFYLYHGGQLYLVSALDEIGNRFVHCYFVSPNQTGDEMALNNTDNGYTYPNLTVNEVIEIGTEISPFEIKS